jgi:ferrous iron transport protein B
MGRKNACACHVDAPPEKAGLKKIVMVGNPNVGKSALFNRLTGTYVVVSNYPGTTVAVSRGNCQIGHEECTLEDTPGMYSMLPITGEERVTRDILLSRKADMVLHVIDAKNLKRMLPLTLQLIEAQLPVVLVLNMIDEADRISIRIDAVQLEKELGIPVVATSALTGYGIDELKETLVSPSNYPKNNHEIDYGAPIEKALTALSPLMPEQCGLSQRSQALLLIQDDPGVNEMFDNNREGFRNTLAATLSELNATKEEPTSYTVSMTLHKTAAKICEKFFSHPQHTIPSLSKQLSEWTMNPITGIPILLLVLYFGLYKFVGGFGAGTVVDFLEADIFETYVNPWINDVITRYIPWQPIRELIGLEYGIVTLGIRYAIAIILPIVGTFFIAFSIIEDSGYLPRLAMLVDRLFKKIGLSGRAVIPMTLGLGCDTMATMVTRTLETKRERIIATLLLALAIPCSAQLGVILGMMSLEPAAMLVWGSFI